MQVSTAVKCRTCPYSYLGAFFRNRKRVTDEVSFDFRNSSNRKSSRIDGSHGAMTETKTIHIALGHDGQR